MKYDIKRLRKRLNLTQEEMALRLGIDRSHLSRLERGKSKPGGSVQILLAQIRSGSHQEAAA